MGKLTNISGKRFGHLVAIKIAEKTKNFTKWECKCDCGSVTNIRLFSLKSGNSQSCGKCQFKVEKFKKNFVSHNKIKDRKTALLNNQFSQYKSGAETSNRLFNLNKATFNKLLLTKCHYCYKDPYRLIKDKFSNYSLLIGGIDRVDSDLGYIKDNCVPCCEKCNFMKNDMSLDEFKAHVNLLWRNFNEMS